MFESLIQQLQTLLVSLSEYSAAGKKVVGFVERPERCPRCGEVHAFHIHAYYGRYVDMFQICIVRFRCRYCALDVSILPSFAMPYKNSSVKQIDAFFNASDEERSLISGHDQKQSYWKQWSANYTVIMRTIGGAANSARGAWQVLKERYGSIAAAQVRLVSEFSRALLRCYRIHRCKMDDVARCAIQAQNPPPNLYAW